MERERALLCSSRVRWGATAAPPGARSPLEAALTVAGGVSWQGGEPRAVSEAEVWRGQALPARTPWAGRVRAPASRVFSTNLRTVKRFGLGGTFDDPAQLYAIGRDICHESRDICHQSRVLQAPSAWPGALQGWAIHSCSGWPPASHRFLMANLNLPPLHVEPLALVLPLQTLVKSLSPSSAYAP